MARKNDVGAWMKFHPADWLASVTQDGLTLAEQGAYMRLLCIAWDRGGIPANPKRRAAMLGVSADELAELWDAIGAKWEAHPDDPTQLVNRRQEEVRAGQEAIVAQRREAGKKGAAKRWGLGPDGGATGDPNGGGGNEPDSGGMQDSGLRAQDSGDRQQQGSGARAREAPLGAAVAAAADPPEGGQSEAERIFRELLGPGAAGIDARAAPEVVQALESERWLGGHPPTRVWEALRAKVRTSRGRKNPAGWLRRAVTEGECPPPYKVNPPPGTPSPRVSSAEAAERLEEQAKAHDQNAEVLDSAGHPRRAAIERDGADRCRRAAARERGEVEAPAGPG